VAFTRGTQRTCLSLLPDSVAAKNQATETVQVTQLTRTLAQMPAYRFTCIMAAVSVVRINNKHPNLSFLILNVHEILFIFLKFLIHWFAYI